MNKTNISNAQPQQNNIDVAKAQTGLISHNEIGSDNVKKTFYLDNVIRELREQCYENETNGDIQMGLPVWVQEYKIGDIGNSDKYHQVLAIVIAELGKQCYKNETRGKDTGVPIWLQIYKSDALDEKHWALVFELVNYAAEAGGFTAQFLLALFYFYGKGVEKNKGLAIEWLKKATEQDYAEAQLCLAYCYFEGIEVEQNDGLGVEWLKKTAEHNHAYAQLCLAFCYLDGKGVEQNLVVAMEWLTKSIENIRTDILYFYPGYDDKAIEASLLLSEPYRQGALVEKNKEYALAWNTSDKHKDFSCYFSELLELRVQYEVTCLKVCSRLVSFYLKDNGIDSNFALAMEKTLAAEASYEIFDEDWSDCQYQLALAYLAGEGVEKSHVNGVKWMIIAAEHGHVEASNWLAKAYISLAIPSYLLEKEHPEQYYKLVVESCLKEVDGHNVNDANLLLGVLYHLGKGIEQNDERALDCFEKAYDIAYDRADSWEENHIFEIFPRLYLSIYYAQGKRTPRSSSYSYSIENVAYTFSKGDYDSWDFGILIKAFAEGLMAMPFWHIQCNKVFLTLLHISLYKKAGEYELAKAFSKDVFDNTDGMDLNFKEVCLVGIEQEQEIAEKNQELEKNNKLLQETNNRMQKLVEQFTHTLGNVIFPDTIYQVAERLKNNPDCRKDVLLLHEAYHSEIIIKLQGELLRQRYANTNPEKFRQLIRSCRRTSSSSDKTKSIEDILDYAISRVTARFLNQHYAALNSIREKILAKLNISLDDLKQKFEDDILLNKSMRPVAWVSQNLRPIQITQISPLWKQVFILAESHAEALLFGYFSEILFNAFKYAHHDKDAFLTLVFDETTINDKTYLTCSWENPIQVKTPTMLGTGKGLDAIQEDLKQLNDAAYPEESLLISKQIDQFKVMLFFKKDLLVNELPPLKLKRKADEE